jgi:hypothetical protein
MHDQSNRQTLIIDFFFRELSVHMRHDHMTRLDRKEKKTEKAASTVTEKQSAAPRAPAIIPGRPAIAITTMRAF